MQCEFWGAINCIVRSSNYNAKFEPQIRRSETIMKAIKLNVSIFAKKQKMYQFFTKNRIDSIFRQKTHFFAIFRQRTKSFITYRDSHLDSNFAAIPGLIFYDSNFKILTHNFFLIPN
jgi:hypothetical protein